MKQSLAWLWLIGGVLYAASVWLSVDAVNIAGEKGRTPASSSLAIPTSSPLTASAKSEQIVEARTEPIAQRPSLDPGLASPSAASEPGPSEQAPDGPATVVQTERFVVRSAANIRNAPSSKSTLIGTAPAGAELEVAEREGGWVRFVDPATSHTGWIYEGLLAPVAAQSVPLVAGQSNAASENTAAKPKAKVRNATRTVSGGVKQRAGNRPYALGYAPNPSAEEFGANKRRFGFFGRRRMVREGFLGRD
jgi:hypothetical protein